MWVAASVQVRHMDSVQAILTVPGYKASQGEPANRAHLGGGWQQVPQQGPGLGLGLGLELAAVGEAGTEGPASTADMTAAPWSLEAELGPGLWSVPAAVL